MERHIPPSCEAGLAAKAVDDGGLQRTGEHLPDRLTGVVEADSLGHFCWRVPRHFFQTVLATILGSSIMRICELTEERNHARIGGAFAEAKKRAQNVDLLRVVGKGDKTGDDAPDDFDRRQPPAGAHIGHDDLRGNQHDAVRHVEVCRESCKKKTSVSVPLRIM